jgi:hypothetical protein
MQYIVTGWLRGEAFYRGRPTSYWQVRLQAWQGSRGFWLNVDGSVTRRHANATWSDVLFSTNAADDDKALLGEALACATSPAPWLVARPRPEPTIMPLMFIDRPRLHLRLASAPQPWWQQLLTRLGLRKEEDPAEPELLQGDRAAEPVLCELVGDPDVGDLARNALRAIREKDAAP